MKALHIVPFEIFTSTSIRMWKRMPVSNIFISIDHPEEGIIYELEEQIIQVSEKQLVNILQDNDKYDMIVFHSLPTKLYEFIPLIPYDKIIIWQSVGYDIYYEDYPFNAIVPLKLYKQITNSYIKKEVTTHKDIRAYIFRIINKICNPYQIVMHGLRKFKRRKYEKKKIKLQNNVLKRIDYISTVLKPEYDLLSCNPNIRAKYFHFKYIEPFKESYGDYIIDFRNTKYVQIGNSGDPSNNHLDLLDIVRERGILTPLYVPLAYGGNSVYKQYIMDILEESSQNVVQTKFVSKAEYKVYLRLCRAAIFGHVRQQALGNIFTLLMQGSKIFLYEDSVAYKFFKELGVYVYSIEQDLCQESIDTPLTLSQIEYNRNTFIEEYDKVTKGIMNDLVEIEEELNERRRKEMNI